MRLLPRVFACTALVVATSAACGGSATTPSSQPTGSRTASSHPTTSQSQSPVFPLTIMRTGGIAGFRDVVVVSGDGLVSITRKGQAPRHCRLTASAIKLLTAAATRVSWSRATPARTNSTEPSFPDDMVTSVQSPAGGPVRLAAPQAGTRDQVFNELLNDLGSSQGSTAASRLCPPS